MLGMIPQLSNKLPSVSAIIQQLNNTFQAELGTIQFQGEISSAKQYSSGHLYFDLKDDKGKMPAVMWASTLTRLKFKPEDGQKVEVSAYFNLYAPSGQMKAIVTGMRLAGQGGLLEKFNQLKEKLNKEGLFDIDRKRSLPFLPHKVGLITSASGAVIEDMMVKLNERMPNLEVELYNATVQGPTSHLELVAGVKFFNESSVPPEVLVIARGGGSLEDLWSFNEEALVRAVFASKIPVISGVGHEPDITLTDLVADYRAPTPTAAAEKVVPNYYELRELLQGYFDRLSQTDRVFGNYQHNLDLNSERYFQAIEQYLNQLSTKFANSQRLLALVEPGRLLATAERRVGDFSDRFSSAYVTIIKEKEAAIKQINLEQAFARKLNNLEQSLEFNQQRLAGLNPKNILKRGYSLIKKDGRYIRSSEEVRPQDLLDVEIADGEFLVNVERVK